LTSREIVLNLIGGERVDGETRFEVRDPGRPGEVVAEVAEGGAEHVDRAVIAASAIGRVWSETPIAERILQIEDGIARIGAAAAELAVVLVRENGALLREAQLDLQRSLELGRDMLTRAEEHLGPQTVDHGGDVVTVLRKPIGVVGMVVPWNSPMVLAWSKVAPALVAGNTLVLKPSPEAPVALTRAMELLAAALPPGVVNVVNSAAGAGPALSAHPKVRKMSFTGSTEVGRHVMAEASGNLKRISLELGGNDPAILLADVDLAETMEALTRGVFTRAGQICFGIKRIYVARSRYREFVDAFCAHVDKFVVGYGLSECSTFGPMINERQSDRLLAFVSDARASGATVRELGRIDLESARAGGYYLRPTVVTDLPQAAALVMEEQFGPAIPILPFDGIDDAIRFANDSEFGLASSVWSADTARAFDVATRLDAGATFINSHNIWSLTFDMPFGGVKQSGLGRERTTLGLDEYVETHAIRTPPSTT
jgi:acyl-CoA reductase-like NAD-dependent aldehyde dehydrogenase